MVITFAGGLWLAPGPIAHWRALMTLIGTAFLVAASNTFNMYLERDVDPLMERTRDRPLPRGTLSPETSLVFGSLLACFAVPLVFLGSNLLTGILGLAALGSYVAVYTPLKRHSAIALFVGAVPGALPPLMGWTTVTGRLDAPGLALFGDPLLLADPALLRDRHLPGRRVRAGRVQGAAGAGLAPNDAGDDGGVLDRARRLDAGPGPAARGGQAYLACALALGAAFIAWTAAGFRRAAAPTWARGPVPVFAALSDRLFVAIALGRTAA